jgi:hypothetical protein
MEGVLIYAEHLAEEADRQAALLDAGKAEEKRRKSIQRHTVEKPLSKKEERRGF